MCVTQIPRHMPISTHILTISCSRNTHILFSLDVSNSFGSFRTKLLHLPLPSHVPLFSFVVVVLTCSSHLGLSLSLDNFPFSFMFRTFSGILFQSICTYMSATSYPAIYIHYISYTYMNMNII